MKEKKSFVAFDGTEFTTKALCLEYEKYLDIADKISDTVNNYGVDGSYDDDDDLEEAEHIFKDTHPKCYWENNIDADRIPAILYFYNKIQAESKPKIKAKTRSKK